MARRKRELLDLLRERAKQNDASGSAESAQLQAPKEAPAPRSSAPKLAPSQPKVSQARRSASTSRPAAPAKTAAAGASWFAEHRAPVLATIALLVSVGAFKLWPGSNEPAEASGGEGIPAAAESNEPFAVLVATYAYTPDRVKIAQTTGRALRDLFSDLPDPKLILYPQSNPELIELWIGEAPEPIELQELLRAVQESTVPTDPTNKRPFASARIERRRSITTN